MSATRTLTEPQAWREIARRLNDDDGIGPFSWAGKLRLDEGLIDYGTHKRMWDRGDAFFPRSPGPLLFPLGVRILAALFLALEAEDDARSRTPDDREGGDANA